MNTLEQIAHVLQIDLNQKSPIEIPNFGRDGLADLFAVLGFRRGVELGVEQGLYTEVLAEANPDCAIYGVDAWAAYPDYREHVSQGKLDRFHQETRARLSRFPNVHLVREFSSNALYHFDDSSLDFVYIDANHTWPYITFDIYQWSKKVKPGGIVSGHDYRKSKRKDTLNHTVEVINAYTQAYRISPWFILGRKDIIPGEARDHARSWMWVKE